MALITVSTVPAVLVPVGKLQIIARTRATKDKDSGIKKEIATSDRSRSILIPEFRPNVSSKYTSIVTAALAETAKQQLAAMWEDNTNLREVEEALYSEDSLLAYAARESESKKLNAESIVAWFKQSALMEEFLSKYNDKQIARFQKELENIAAPTLSPDFYNEEKAMRRMVALTRNERDAEHDLVIVMVQKLQRYIDRIRKTREEIGSIEEIAD